MKIITPLLCLLLFALPVATQAQQAERVGLKPVFINGKWGYADGSDKVVIQPRFDEVHPFSEGLAAVAIGTDPNAKSFIAGSSGNMSYAFSVIRDDLVWGYIDETGKFVIQLQFKMADEFSEGFASVTVGAHRWSGKCGYINGSGAIILEPQFDTCTKFIDGRAWVIKYQLVDKPAAPEKAPPPPGEFVLLDRGDEFLAGEYGYIDRNGKFTETSMEEWFSRKARANNSFNRTRN